MTSSLRTLLMMMSSSIALSSLAGQAFAQSGTADQDPTEIDEIIVVGYRAQNAQAIQARRQDERIADYLAADDIGSQPDYNISDAIRRLPGIQTVFDEDEGKFVSIRGLNPSYTLGAMAAALSAMAGQGLTTQLVVAAAVGGLGAVFLGQWRKRQAITPQDAQDQHLDLGSTVLVEAWDAQGLTQVKHRGALWSATSPQASRQSETCSGSCRRSARSCSSSGRRSHVWPMPSRSPACGLRHLVAR
jgi:membrane protein implicated in regulation of membrane protease activity